MLILYNIFYYNKKKKKKERGVDGNGLLLRGRGGLFKKVLEECRLGIDV